MFICVVYGHVQTMVMGLRYRQRTNQARSPAEHPYIRNVLLFVFRDFSSPFLDIVDDAMVLCWLRLGMCKSEEHEQEQEQGRRRWSYCLYSSHYIVTYMLRILRRCQVTFQHIYWRLLVSTYRIPRSFALSHTGVS